MLAVDAQGEVANCSLTAYERKGGRLVLHSYNEVDHLERSAAGVTVEPDAPRAAC